MNKLGFSLLLLLAGTATAVTAQQQKELQQNTQQQSAQATAQRQANSANQSKGSQSSEAAETVVIESTITGNLEQPKTIYVLPWQDSLAPVQMPAAVKNNGKEQTKPLDREQFLRFIKSQPHRNPTDAAVTPSSNNLPLNK